MSRSLQSSIEYLGGSNRWSRNDSDMVPWKSSIGLISSKISSRPDLPGTSPRPSLRACSTRARHLSLPSSQSKLSVCNARRLGTSSGSRILAKEMRRGAVLFLGCCLFFWLVAVGLFAVREAAKRGSFRGLAVTSAHAGHPAANPRRASGGCATGEHTLRAGERKAAPRGALRVACHL